MSGQRLKHCDPLFKKEHRSHVHCHKRKSPSYYFGDRLNAFLKKDVLENGKEYRVCDNLCRQIDAVKVVRQSTIRRARVSKDAVPGRMVSLSTNKHMRAVQKEYQLIVDLSDQASKVEKVKENFVWMGAIRDHLKYDHVGMFLRLDEGSLFRVLEVRKSEVEGSGLGLFAACDFLKGEIVTIFVGKEIEKNVHSIFSISNSLVILDAGPWCAANMDKTYLAAHMANDPNWREEDEDGGDGKKIDTNVESNSHFELVAIKPIKAGDEILLSYNLTHN